MTDDFIDIIITNFKNSKNNEKLKTLLIDPIILYITDKCYPYLIASGIIFILTFILVLSIFFISMRSFNNI